MLARRISVVPRTALVMTGVAVTTALLGIATSLTALAFVAVISGVARGIKTLLHATAVTERWGATHYGHLSGMFSAPVTLATALGPWIGVVLASVLGGYAPMFLVLGGVGVVAALIRIASIPSS
jgi:MFS family permease